jgi:hypothetical protein
MKRFSYCFGQLNSISQANNIGIVYRSAHDLITNEPPYQVTGIAQFIGTGGYN